MEAPSPKDLLPRQLSFCILATALLLSSPMPASAESYRLHALQSDNLTVLYGESLEQQARNLAAIYPDVRRELEERIGWTLIEPPTVVLIDDREVFQFMVGSPHVAAVAIPGDQLILIDYTHMTAVPSRMRNTLQHELSHLLLRRHIDSRLLPLWLDEGIAQWASDGFTEITLKGNRFLLPQAVHRGNDMPLRQLEQTFPRNERSRLLAYEKSKSVVEYIIMIAGKEGLLEILELLRRGRDIDEAVAGVLDMSILELEGRWRDHIASRPSRFAFASYYLYEFLFVLAALLSVIAFVRVVRAKRRRYRLADDDEADDDAPFAS